MKIKTTYNSNKLTLQLNLGVRKQYFHKKKLEKLLQLATNIFSHELEVYPKIDQFELNLNLIADAQMKRLNLLHRKKNKTTDVLSFPLESMLYKNKKLSSPVVLLGDLFISAPVCARQAKERAMSFERELLHLLVHGFYHLQDYDHERSSRDEKLMFNLEEKCLKRIVVQFSNL